MPDTMRLYTFTVSHFSEKARWGLDRSGAVYQEIILLPGLHGRRLKRLGARGQVPVLTQGSRVIDGSSAILDHLDASIEARNGLPPLLPREPSARREVLEWEAYLDREVGETVRLVLYFHVIRQPKLLVRAWSNGGPFWAPFFHTMIMPGAIPYLVRSLSIDAEAARRDEERLLRAFEKLEARLTSRQFLVGDGFTRADLALAALSAPLLRPHGHPWPTPEGMGSIPEVERLAQKLSASATAERVKAAYARRKEVGGASVDLRASLAV